MGGIAYGEVESLLPPLPLQVPLAQFWRQRPKCTVGGSPCVSQRVTTHRGTRGAVGGASVTVLNNMLPYA